MAGHDVGPDTVPLWAQISAGLTFIGVVGMQILRFLREWNKDVPVASHAVIEGAELADMQPLRDLSKRLADVFPMIEDLDERMNEALRILRAQERADLVAKEVEDRMRDERIRADRLARDRDRTER